MDAELGALAKRAAGLDFAAVGLDDSMGEGEAEAGAFLACRKERPKDSWKRVGRDPFAVVFDPDESVIAFAGERDIDRAFPRNGLDSVEHQIQDDLLNERRIVGYGRKGRVWRKQNFHGTRAHLLLGKHDGLLDRDIQIGGMESGRPRTRVGEQIVQDVLDVEDLVLNVGEDGTAAAVGREFSAHQVNHAGDAREGIANFVGEAGGEFAKCGEVFCPAHFAAVEFFDFEAIALELLDHFVELPAELADVVATLREGYPGG